MSAECREKEREERRENEWERVKETPKRDNSGSGGGAQTAFFLFFSLFLFSNLILSAHLLIYIDNNFVVWPTK